MTACKMKMFDVKEFLAIKRLQKSLILVEAKSSILQATHVQNTAKCIRLLLKEYSQPIKN